MPVGGDGQGSGRVAGAGVYLLTVSSRFSSGFPFNNILLFCLPPSTALIMILVLITCLPSGLDGQAALLLETQKQEAETDKLIAEHEAKHGPLDPRKSTSPSSNKKKSNSTKTR